MRVSDALARARGLSFVPTSTIDLGLPTHSLVDLRERCDVPQAAQAQRHG